MGKPQKNQSGFAALEAVLILVIIGILGFTGWFVWQAKNNADKSLLPNNSTTPVIKKKATTSPSKAQPNVQTSPTEFVDSLLGILANGNEASLNAGLTQSFVSYRTSNLAHLSCAGKTITNPMVLFCGSLLDPSHVKTLRPAVTDYSFKDGTKGKSVTYQETQTSGDTGTTYYSFKLVPVGSSWQLNDYVDLFVPTGSSVPNPLLGIQESGS